MLNEHAPLRQIHLRGSQVPYMTADWRKAIRHGNRLWKKFRNECNDDNYAQYKAQRNRCTTIRHKAIKAIKLISGMCIVLSYTVRNLAKQAYNDITLRENDSVITDKKQIAGIFNDHFVHLVEGICESDKQDLGTGFSDHPSVRAILDNSGE